MSNGLVAKREGRFEWNVLCRDLCKKAFPLTAETQTQFFGCFRFKYPLILPKHPLNLPRTPHNRASGPPFRRQQAHLACWPLSTGSNTSPSDGFAHSLYTDQRNLTIVAGTLILDFLASRTVRNTCLLYVRMSVFLCEEP